MQLGFLAPAAALAQMPFGAPDFLALSHALTGHASLNETMGNRLFAALAASDSGFAGRAAALLRLMQKSQTPQQLLAQANAAGLGDAAHEIVAGWYTGTVTHGGKSMMVAYADALMYATVSDGLTVPTYCSNGPLWWSKKPPAVGVNTPAEAAKARLAAPVTNKQT